MRKLTAMMMMAGSAALMGSALQANFTVYDLAKDSMFIVRGEFTSLERTVAGDRLSLQCTEVIKGNVPVGGEVVLEAFEKAAADDALGRDVIVCFHQVNGAYYFVNHPYSWRSFIFEESDVAPAGLDQNEQAIRSLLAINQPHQEVIEGELRKRLQLQDAGFMGSYDPALITEWKNELLRQMAWSGTRAAQDAAKALCEHPLFKGQMSVADIEKVGSLLAASAPGTIERSYMLEIVRNQNSAHPSLNVLLQMVREETADYCVGKLSNLLFAISDRAAVLAAVGEIAGNTGFSNQSRANALQIFEALKDVNGLGYVHAAITTELERGENFSKQVMRRAMRALRSTPDASSMEVLDICLAHEKFVNSWELTQWGWVAYSMINNETTNNKIRAQYNATTHGKKRFFQKLLPENQIIRKLMIIHPED